MKHKRAVWPWSFVIVTLALSSLSARAPAPAPQPWPDAEGPNGLAAALASGKLPSAPAGGPDIGFPDGCGETVLAGKSTASFPIADPPASNSVVTATINVTESVPYTFAIAALISISHTSPGDLVIDLISPDGTDVTLSNRRGGGHANVFTFTEWVDLADIGAEPVTEANFGASSPPHVLIPEEAMGGFAGKDVKGVWKLVVADKAAGDVGTLNGALLLIIGMSRPITTTTHYSHNTPAILSDTVDLYSPLLVNGPNERIISARLTTNIGHPKPRQLSFELGAPGPVTTTLSNHNGGFLFTNFANWFAGTVWDDQAGDLFPPGAVTMDQAVYPTSPLTATVPEGAMSQFVGLRPNGIWRLHITDQTIGGGGTLNSWSLDLTTAHCLPLYLPLVGRS